MMIAQPFSPWPSCAGNLRLSLLHQAAQDILAGKNAKLASFLHVGHSAGDALRAEEEIGPPAELCAKHVATQRVQEGQLAPAAAIRRLEEELREGSGNSALEDHQQQIL